MNQVQGYLIVRDEIDIIDEVLTYHQDLGQPILVIDNGSSDGTEASLQKWAAKGIIDLIMFPTPEYDLKALLEMTVRMAVERAGGWLLHIDADHFYDPPAGIDSLRELARAAEQEGANVVNFVECTFYHTGLDPSLLEAPCVQLRQRFYSQQIGGLNQPRLFRSIPAVDVHSDGGHSIVFPDTRVIWFSQEGILRHYPFRSFDQGRKKLAARRARYSNAGRARNWHRQYDGMQQDGWFVPDPHRANLELWKLGDQLNLRGRECRPTPL